MCSVIITKNKPQKGRELLHSLPCCSVLRSEDLRQLGPNVPFGEHAPPLLDPAEDFIADLADLLGGDGIGDRLQMKLSLVVHDRIEVEADPIAEIILQSTLGDVAIPQLGIESEDQHKPIFQRIGHVVALDEGKTVAALHKRRSVHFPFFIGEMPSAILIIALVGDVELHLDPFLIEDGLGAHSPSELDFLLGIEDPPECRLLVPAVGLSVTGTFSDEGTIIHRFVDDRVLRILSFLCHFDTPF